MRPMLVDRDPGDETTAATVGSDVFAWRLERLLKLGYDQEQAAELADSRVDIHDIEKLIAAGCRPDIAARVA